MRYVLQRSMEQGHTRKDEILCRTKSHLNNGINSTIEKLGNPFYERKPIKDEEKLNSYRSQELL